MKGDPRAPRNSRLADNYKRGVEIGNWGLTINAASSAVYCGLSEVSEIYLLISMLLASDSC